MDEVKNGCSSERGMKNMNVKIEIEYEGTNYSGWQKQEGVKTIQEEIERALSKITGEAVEIFGSGRTDAGVHALGQVASFNVQTTIPPERIRFALNQHLPEDIRILKSMEVDEGFHARFSARRKTYLYRIQMGEVRRPFERKISYYTKDHLDIQRMCEAAGYFIGEHDFSSFKSEGSTAKDFVRTIYFLDVRQCDDMVEIEITGNGFLYNMVRIIAGTLVEIGRGKEYDISAILAARDRKLAGPTAPAHGLFLKEVLY